MFKQENYGGHFTVIAFHYSKPFDSFSKGSEGEGPVTTKICKTLQRRPGVKYFRGVTFLETELTNSGSVPWWEGWGDAETEVLMTVKQMFQTSDTI
jgi:hypothetical protein